jgi:hypothetical protein
MERDYGAEIDELKVAVAELVRVMVIGRRRIRAARTGAGGAHSKMHRMHPDPNIMKILDTLKTPAASRGTWGGCPTWACSPPAGGSPPGPATTSAPRAF